MFTLRRHWGAAFAAALLTACGSDSTTSTVASSNAHGTLVENPPFRIASLNAASFQAAAVRQHHRCTAAADRRRADLRRGLLLHQVLDRRRGRRDHRVLGRAHGADRRRTDLLRAARRSCCTRTAPGPTRPATSPTSPTPVRPRPRTMRTLIVAAMFAAQGYIVVAPNYAGYDISTLGYHPFLNAAQQSGEMIDALTAARTALPNTLSSATSDSGKLFVTGYSEGGYVAMATQRAMEAAGRRSRPRHRCPGPTRSKPLAMRLFSAASISARPRIRAAGDDQLSARLRQHLQRHDRRLLLDLRDRHRHAAAEHDADRRRCSPTASCPRRRCSTARRRSSRCPATRCSSAELTAALAVPSNPANPDTPLFDPGFGSPYLINNSYRVSYALDAAEQSGRRSADADVPACRSLP